MKRGRNQRRRQGTNPNRALDSNGPEVRIRGTANQVYDKYIALARDASSAGDRVKAENYLQHAEHYFRLIRSMQPAQQPRPANGEGEGEQPAVDGRDARDGRDGERRTEQSRPNGAEASEAEEKTEAPAKAAEASAEAEPEPEKKPRRRRARRPAKSAEPTDAESETSQPENAAAAAE